MSTISLALFIVSTAIHLYASLKQNKKLRAITKPFILLALLWWYLVTCTSPVLGMVLALAFSWLGDVFLIIPGVKYFAIGGVSFLIGHAFFALSYMPAISYNNFFVIIPIAIIYIAIVLVVFSKLRPHLPKGLFYPMALYLLVNAGMNCCAILRMLSNPCAPTIFTCIGAILFFISDSTLFFVRFKKDSKIKTHFSVMLTYSIGEFLIVLGMIPNLF